MQHWLLLLACWQDPQRSMEAVAEVVRENVPVLLYGLTRRLALTTALRLLCEAVADQCSISASQTRLLLGQQLFGLT